MPLTAEPLVWRVDASGQWTYEFKADEADLHELRKRIQLYERPPSAEAPPSSSVSTWEYYKKVVNPYELVYTQKKYDDFPESVCIYHPLSRSYFKILEVLAITDFFKDCKPSQRLYSAHVCEGPGGFIQGFLEECSRRRLTVGASTAITLKPKQQNVPGWKRATHFLQKNKQATSCRVRIRRTLFGQLRVRSISLRRTGGLTFLRIMTPRRRRFFPSCWRRCGRGLKCWRQGGCLF